MHVLVFQTNCDLEIGILSSHLLLCMLKTLYSGRNSCLLGLWCSIVLYIGPLHPFLCRLY